MMEERLLQDCTYVQAVPCESDSGKKAIVVWTLG